MAETRTYALNGKVNLSDISSALENYLSVRNNLRTQRFDMENRTIIQCVGDDSQWKKFLGMDAAITVELKTDGEILTVTVGNAKWIDKMGAATVGAILFAPLLITAGLGALRQTALPEEVFDFIEGLLLNRSSAFEAGSLLTCPDCGRRVNVGDAFCPAWGEKLS